MVLPNLINPVSVTLEQVSAAATIYDPDLEEPIGNVQHATAVSLVGQVRWTSSRDLRVDRAGAKLKARGYVVFRVIDLAAKGVSLAVGDRFTLLGAERGRWWINRLVPMAHYGDQGGATLMHAHFADREPAKS